jgi:hypothetical protein
MTAARFTLSATSVGAVAADLLRSADTVEVIAVYERSFYLMAPTGIVAIVADDLGDGPINIRLPTTTSGQVLWPSPLVTGMAGRVDPQELRLGDDLAISLARAPFWLPPPWPQWHPARASAGVQRLAATARAAVPIEGLAPLVFAPQRALTRTGAAAKGLLTAFSQGLREAADQGMWSPDALASATLLVGLGPGLTPSGDDVLGGVMLALSAADRAPLRDALWDAIVDELGDLTVPVSAMHLSAAADGMAHETLHRFANALLSDDVTGMAAALPAVTALGATSGWDALAGLALGLRALSDTRLE